jgi:type IV pilus assembly protein PilM
LRKRKVIGIDPGVHSLKVVQFRVPKKGRVVLEKSACFPWQGKDRKLAGARKEFKNYLHACSISRGSVCSSLDHESLYIRRVSLPAMPEKEMQEVLRFKVRKEMEGGPDDIVVDYLPLEKNAAPAGELSDFMVFAVSRKALDSHLKLLETAGIKPVCVEPQAMGLSHLFGAFPGPEAIETVLLLDMGFSRTSLILIQGRRPLFIRDLPFSGRHLTESIQGALNVDGKTAEEWKKKTGLGEPAETAHGSESVPEVLGPLLEELFTEIRYSLGYVQDQIVSAPAVHRICLAGGGAGLPGLAKALEGVFQIPCSPLPGFQELGLDVSDDFKSYGQPATASELGTALGLALREARG